MEQISVRFTPTELERIDKISIRLKISRNEAIRTVLNEGFEAVEG